MTYVFAICLLFAAGSDPADADRRSAGEVDGGTAAAMDKLLESLNREFEASSDDPLQSNRRAQLYATRGWLLLRKGELEKAGSDFDAAITLDPRSPYARSGRAEYFRRIGDSTRAEHEMRQVVGLPMPDNSTAFDGNLENPFDFGWISAVEAWVVVALFWMAVIAINIIAGWRQKVEAAGSLARLLWVAVWLATIEVLPLFAWAGFVSSAGATRIPLPMAAGMTLLSLIFTAAYLKAPVHLRGTKEQLPCVIDEPFLARVAELAAKMRVSVSVVRLWPSVSGTQQAQAAAGTLQAPQIVVTDGILRRLEQTEGDAIVAHELAHIANGSLWALSAVIPVSCAAATIASAFLPQSIVWPFGLAFLVGFRRLVSRQYELDCDRRAARAVGYRETAAALAKIHAVHPVRNSGLVSLLVYATATHPSREIRLAALRDDAPEAERHSIEVSQPRIRQQRCATWAAFVIWLATISGTIAASLAAPQTWLLWIPLWSVALTPMALLYGARRKKLVLKRNRMGTHRQRFVAGIASVVVAALVLLLLSLLVSNNSMGHMPSAGLRLEVVTMLLFLLAIIAVIVWLLVTNRRRELRKSVAIALQVHDFNRVVELAQRSPRDVSRDHILRYNVAIARAVCGDRTAAITMLDGLWQDKPNFPLTGFALAQLQLDTGQPEQALAVAQALARRLPHDAGTHVLEARIRRRLRQLDEAQAACNLVLELEPEDGAGYGIAASLALDSGNLTGAQELITQALGYSPGDSHLLLIQAEIAIQTAVLDEARSLVAEVVTAVRTNPLVFLDTDIKDLEQKLAEHELRQAIPQGVLETSISPHTAPD
jgi:Zn-dependent protease with chaperone function/Flp pilus assembly protein TadD